MLLEIAAANAAFGVLKTALSNGRDLYECGYCGERHLKSELTTDHVQPLSKGGKNVWNNCITACKPCNWRKGDKVGPEWRPRYKPYTPGYYELVRKRKQLDFTIRHPSWYQWLDLDVKTS